MFDTDSVFDVLAADDSDRRDSQRKALTLASVRLDNNLGRFLRGAVSMEEFEARLAACQDDFALHVAEACAETGFDSPERIAKVLAANYVRERRWQPIVAEKKDDEEQDPGEMQDSNDGKGVLEPHQDDADKDAPKIKSSSAREAYGPGYDSLMEPQSGVPGAPPADQPPVGPGYKSDPWGSQGVDPYTCHGCGQQSLEFAQTGSCPHCGTHGGAPAQMTAAQKTAESGNTDLAGPEPVMDKRLWTPENLPEPDVADGRWPTERKDITEPVGPPNNEHPLKEIGDIESQSLPNNSGDAGFSADGPGPAPHTDTWSGSGDLATPVTSSANDDDDDDSGHCPSCGAPSDDDAMCSKCMQRKERQVGA